MPTHRTDVPLRDHTTLAVGGAAKYWIECTDETELRDALQWARRDQLMVTVLGGGSNVLVSDAGFDGLVIRMTDRTLDIRREPGGTTISVGVGYEWDHLVAEMVREKLAGIECLSGIPGWVGAAPIQNIGAYGQEVAETIVGLRVVHRFTGEAEELPADMLGFSYRQSRFKDDWKDRYVITRVDFRLQQSDRGAVRYPALKQKLGLGERDPGPELAVIRDAVLDIRREKSMVLDPNDENRRSAGSFFVNPVVPDAVADSVQRKARAMGANRSMPRFATPGGIKLSAAWLIEEAGFPRGFQMGEAGLSSKHTLALINRGRASADELIDLAREIRRTVHRAFGVVLTPEPVFVGFQGSVDALLS